MNQTIYVFFATFGEGNRGEYKDFLCEGIIESLGLTYYINVGARNSNILVIAQFTWVGGGAEGGIYIIIVQAEWSLEKYTYFHYVNKHPALTRTG